MNGELLCTQVARLCIVLAFVLTSPAALSAADPNRVPNPGFVGDDGDKVGTVTGTVPDFWRGFAVNGGAIELTVVPLAANALFQGSPATNAVQLTVGTFGGDQGFDHTNVTFTLVAGHQYQASVYLRSANSGGAAQGVSIGLPVFDANGFTSRQPGSFGATATAAWQKFTGPEFSEANGTVTQIAFRLSNDGGENSVLIALPRVDGPPLEVAEVDYPPVFTAGRDFSPADRWVAATVFHWYAPFAGQLQGPWPPPEGRASWTGDVPFWRDQVKDMMDANIDVLYVHLFNNFHYQREQLFKAIAQLRAEGYDTPYLVPFLDPLIIWNNTGPINVSSSAGKDEYVDWYRMWFDQYLRNDTGAWADTRLLRIDGRVVLNTWHNNPTHVTGLASMTRGDVESRLTEWLGDRTAVFEGGIHQIGTANGIAPPWSDEIAYQFANTEYYSNYVFNGYSSATLKAGYWDQNVRNPGTFFPRNGGAPYKQAWVDLNAARNGANPIYHAYIESWNEYDEGTGIYEAATTDPVTGPNNTGGNDDTWSATDNPREYIDSSYAGASVFNDKPQHDAQFIWRNFPARLSPGASKQARILARNTGNLKWSASRDVELAELSSAHAWGPARQGIASGPNEVSRYGGVFRGRPVLFDFEVTAPDTPGVYPVSYRMNRDTGGPGGFGNSLDLQVAVTDAMVEAGHSGAFYNPARSGEGSFVEILSATSALVYTFSFKPDGSGPAWFLGVGRIEDGAIILDLQRRPLGTVFGDDFNKNDIKQAPAGSMSMAFLDCRSINPNNGSVVFSGESGLGYSPLLTRAARLSQVTGCGMQPHANAGLSGSWYDPARSGEGLIVQWLTNDRVLAIMFTYDPDGNQFWMLGTGTPQGKQVTIEMSYPAASTSWGEDFDPDEVELESWGSVTLNWTSCSAMTFDYSSSVSGFGSATRQYQRLTTLAGTSCPAFP